MIKVRQQVVQAGEIIYDKNIQKILANGENVVDLSSVEDETTAKIHSRVAADDSGFEVIFRFEPNKHFPFCLGDAYSSPGALIRAIVENRLQLTGMKCSKEIDRVYRIVKSRTIDISHINNDINILLN